MIGEADTAAGAHSGAPTSPLADDGSLLSTIRPGVTFANYELIRELGRGGMGRVFLARDTKLGRRVAIKFLQTTSHGMTEKFIAEARITAQLGHENIVIIHEVGEHEGAPHMVLEYLEGTSLRELMDKPLSPARAMSLMVPVVRAVARAHAAGIVHRDLKPENIFVTTDGTVKVLDFGIAKALGGDFVRPLDASDFSPIAAGGNTRVGVLVGTPQYMAPEQFRASVDHRSDLWAIGVILFELLTGRHPLAPFTTASLFTEASMLEDPMPAIRSVVSDLPERLERIVDKCLQKQKDKRFASAEALLAELEAIAPARRPVATDDNPYPGLTAFQREDADRFFGRTRDITRITARLREHPLVAIAGPSGVGKSSFVRAGLVPSLEASGDDWETVVVRPGRRPLASLATTIAPLVRSEADPTPDPARLAIKLANEPGHLGTVLRARAARKSTRILVFVDQLEELYTLVDDPATRIAFTTALAAAADDVTSPIRVVVSIRSDFLDRATEDRVFLEQLTRGLVFLQPMARPELCEALTRPLDLRDYDFDSDALVDRMLADLANVAGALPLLQFTASRLWESRDRSTKKLTTAAYDAMGGVSGALATHADQVLAGLPTSSHSLVRDIFRRLVTPDRTRAIAEHADLVALGPDAQHIIDQLVAARLLVVQTQGTASTVEIVHESLLASWPTLRRWLDEDQDDASWTQQLAAAAKQWDAKQRAPGLLWRGDILDEARRWHAQRPRQLPERERAFLDAALAAAQRSSRARRIALGAVFAVLAIVATGASIGYVRVQAAESSARDALAAQKAEAVARREADDERTAALAALLTEEQLRQAAETGMLTAEQLKAIAEAKQRVAEKQRQDAEAGRISAEQKRAQMQRELERAEAEKLAAHRSAQQHAAEARMTREELVAKNAQLEAALAAARTAREKAEQATQRAEAARQEAERAKALAQKSFETEKARAERLEKERKKITTDLR